ncbi:hypothetical protein TGGT1_205360 [Toxoplasma gondii GT1]|uniref:Transmembrane protein n=2 Tax=Toxoplasma gondii TaxID=5811 RepID=S7W9U2_TOXGG|nr:hypothetical protein TGGT1_205360 [Toxoplasma gondii GT1]KFG36803.1 putative transmembrane protein [Toxoplasma gondii FOU]
MEQSYLVSLLVSLGCLKLLFLLGDPSLALSGANGGAHGFPSAGTVLFSTHPPSDSSPAHILSSVFSAQNDDQLAVLPDTGLSELVTSDDSPERRARAFVELMDVPDEREQQFSTSPTASRSFVKIKQHEMLRDADGNSNVFRLLPLKSPLEEEAKDGTVVTPVSAVQMEQLFSEVHRKDRKIIIKTLKALTRRSFKKADNYISTHSYIAHLTRVNPLFRSIARSDKEKRKLLASLSRVISHRPHRKFKKWKEELFRAVRVLRKYLKIPKVVADTDPFLLECAAHLIADIRQKRHEGYWGFLDGLRHDASLTLYSVVVGTFLDYHGGFDSYVIDETHIIDTCIHMSISVGKLPVFHAFHLPGGLFGSLLTVAVKGYNYMFYPALAATTSLIGIATGLICLTQLTDILFKAFDTIARSLKKGIRLGFMKFYQYRVRGDRVGQNVVSFLAMNKAASLLAILWQLKNVNYQALQDFKTIAPTTHEATFQHGVNFGAVEFSSEIQRHLEEDYLAFRPELDECYGSTQLTPLVELKCDASWKSVERFTEAMDGMISYVSRFNFKKYVGELLLLMYTIVIVNMNVNRSPGDNSTTEGFRNAKGYIDVENDTGAFPSKLFRLPFLKENAHRASVGLSKLALFFQLRRLHQWNPNRDEWVMVDMETGPEDPARDTKSEASTDVPESSLSSSVSLPPPPLQRLPSLHAAPRLAPPSGSRASFLSTPEDLLGVRSFADSADVAREVAAEMRVKARLTLAPDVRDGDWPSPVEELSPEEQKRLNAVRRRRTKMMLRLFYKGVSSLAVAINQLFGRFVHLLMLQNSGKPLKKCPADATLLSAAGVCENDRSLRARDEMPLRLVVSTFAGMFYRRAEGNFGVTTKEEIVQKFMDFIDEIKYGRVQVGFLGKLRRKRPQWILDSILNPLFGEGSHKKVLIKSSEMAIIKAIVVNEVGALFKQVEDSARFKYSRCDTTGRLYILTDLNGGTQFFVTSTPRTPELEEKACRIELQLQETEIYFRGDQVKGGVLFLPGVPPIRGVLSKDPELLTSAEADSDILLIVEGTLWMQGYPRVHARMVGAVLYVSKRLRYPSLSWGEFMQAITPQDLEFAYRILQEGTAEKLQADLQQLDKKMLYSFDFSLGNIWSILLGTMERSVLPIKKQAFLSYDFNIVVGASFVLNIYNNIVKNVSGLTHWYLRFENLYYDELKRAKLGGQEAPPGTGFLEAGNGWEGGEEAEQGSRTQERDHNNSPTSSLSDSVSATDTSDDVSPPFSFVGNEVLRPERGDQEREREDGDEEPVRFSFETDIVLDWNCNAFYENREEERPAKGAASITVDERNALQCSLLHFMRRQPTVSADDDVKLRQDSGKVLAYLQRIVYELRLRKGRSLSSWKSFMNAYPGKPKNPISEIREDLGGAKAFIQRKRQKLRTRFKAWRHKLRSELSKKFFGKRPINAMGGRRFLHVMFIAFVELFPNPDDFPRQVLLTPMQMLQFCGLQTVLRTYTAPYFFDRKKGNSLALQMKASPVPSESHRTALGELDMRVARIVTSDQSEGKALTHKLVRQVGGYLQLLAETSFTGVEVPEYTSRSFLQYVKMKINKERRGTPKTDSEFMALVQMQVTDLTLLYTMLAAIDDVEELKRIQQELTKENFNLAALSAEKLRLYSPYFYFDLSSDTGKSVRGGKRPASMLVLTMECRQQTLSPNWNSANNSLEAFLLFLREGLSPDDISEITWTELSTSEPSRSSPEAETGTSVDAEEVRASDQGDSQEPWKIAMKLPLLTGLEVLGYASEFRPETTENMFAAPSVLCHICEPVDYILPLGLPEWIKLRRDASSQEELFREEQREDREEMSMFDAEPVSAAPFSVPVPEPFVETSEATDGDISAPPADPTDTKDTIEDSAGEFVNAGDVAFVQQRADAETKDEDELREKINTGDKETMPQVEVPLVSRPPEREDKREDAAGASRFLPEPGYQSPFIEAGEDAKVEEGEDVAETVEDDGDETEPIQEEGRVEAIGAASELRLRRAYPLSDEILPLFLDMFHGLYALARPWRLRKDFLRRMRKSLSNAYESRTEVTGEATARDKSRDRRSSSLSTADLKAIFHSVSGGLPKPPTSRNPITEVVFRELHGSVVATRKAVIDENAGKLATWVCINSAREICAAGSTATPPELASAEYRRCVADIEARCRQVDWQEFQVVLQAEEYAIKSGVFVSAMQSVEKQDLRKILETVDDVLTDMIVEELKKHWWAPRNTFTEASFPSDSDDTMLAGRRPSVQKRWLYVKNRLQKCMDKLKNQQPDFAASTVRSVFEPLFFKLARGAFSGKAELKAYLQEMRVTIARAAAIELDETMVSRNVALRHQAHNREMKRRRRRPFYQRTTRAVEDERVHFISHSPSPAGPEAQDFPEPESSLLQVRQDIHDSNGQKCGFLHAESPCSTVSSSSPSPLLSRNVLSAVSLSPPHTDPPVADAAAAEMSGTETTKPLVAVSSPAAKERVQRVSAAASFALLFSHQQKQTEGRGGNEVARVNPADSDTIKDAFGSRIDSSSFNEYTLQVVARREGRLKWLRVYRINAALLTLELLVQLRSGISVKLRGVFKRVREHIRRILFAPQALMRFVMGRVAAFRRR